MGLGNSEDALVDDGDAAECGGGGKSFLASSVSCSICLEIVADNGDRSWAKLQCGHQFHLDCIGSAFNIKGAMQCPNCRQIEKGQWLYANGCRSFPEFNMDDWTHDEDLYDLSYSEMAFGVHWCPFGEVGRFPPSFEEREFASREFQSTAYHNLMGQHAVFAEHTAASSATHPCPYIAYSGPIHPSSSNSGGSGTDGSNFINHWNGTTVPSEVQNSYAFPAVDLHYHSWEHHSPPFSTNSGRVGNADQPLVPPVTQRSARLSDIPRSGSYIHPFLVGHSPGARAGSSVASSMIPPYPGSNARAHDRVQALQAYYQQLQPSNSPALRTPIIPSTRRSSSHRGLTQVAPVASSSDQTGSYYFFPSGTTGRNVQEPESPLLARFHAWERDHLPAFSSFLMERDMGWGTFHRAGGGSESGIRSSSSRQRHGSERSSSQNGS